MTKSNVKIPFFHTKHSEHHDQSFFLAIVHVKESKDVLGTRANLNNKDEVLRFNTFRSSIHPF